ncbi:hypothetical protein AURDEDRAFT_157297 [Auricularia subglabra TFB-10046 SS5]|nr:hypothetical protein AURDEDRAFT_157297 [Auricularia subglabra TFB-10046 SS5]
MARLLIFIVLPIVQCAASWARPRAIFPRNNTMLGTRTASAIRARQATRERIMLRSEKMTMGRLFGRLDCACVPALFGPPRKQRSMTVDRIPEPSTNACPCGDTWELCGVLCRNDFDSRNAAVGECSDSYADPDNCGACGAECDLAGGEECCEDTCAKTQINPEHRGVCGNPCLGPLSMACCSNGLCFDTDDSNEHCGACNIACGVDFYCFQGDCLPEP